MEKYVIGDPADPYLIRWRIFECPWFRIFFHRILKSDGDRHLHDHPYNFVSLIIKGAYWEDTFASPELQAQGVTKMSRRYGWLSLNRKHCLEAHSVHLESDPRLGKGFCPIPAWTLMFAGPRIRNRWCFHTERGKIPYNLYFEIGGDLSKLPEQTFSVVNVDPVCVVSAIDDYGRDQISCVSSDISQIEQIEDDESFDSL